MKNIGKKIQVIRKEMKLTQVEIAKKAGISRSYYADIEGNRYNPSLETLQSIATVLGVPISYFLDDKQVTTTDFDIFETPTQLLLFFINKYSIKKGDINSLYNDNGDLLSDKELRQAGRTLTDRDIKNLSYKLSHNLFESLLIHYKLCQLLIIQSDISKMSPDDRFQYLSDIRQLYYVDFIHQTKFNINTMLKNDLEIELDDRLLSKDEKTILLNSINTIKDLRKD